MAHRRASTLMLLIRSLVEGRKPSKIAALRCFQMAQAVSAMMELRAFLKEAGEASAAVVHQMKKHAASSGGGGDRAIPREYLVPGDAREHVAGEKMID